MRWLKWKVVERTKVETRMFGLMTLNMHSWQVSLIQRRDRSMTLRLNACPPTPPTVPAEALLGDEVTSKVQFFGKQSGRNEIIALIISMAIGKLMTRKQVSSHLQVVRQRKNVHAKGRS